MVGPGGWRLIDGKTSSEKGGQLIISGLPRLNIIAKVYEDTPAFGEFTPDARLLAAAPELLAALKIANLELMAAREMVLRHDDPDEGEIEAALAITSAREVVQAAIAKAEGRGNG